MKKISITFLSLIVLIISCGKELPLYYPEPTYTVVDTSIQNQLFLKLTGKINNEFTMESGSKYFIEGKLAVEERAILNIEPGVEVYSSADLPTYLLIERDAILNAQGTMDSPIVFTSINTITGSPKPGDWIGIHINGNAKINDRNTGLTLEIGRYGKTENAEPDDNSGKISYLRVEYAGKEMNGISGAINFNGVGYRTQVSSIQSYKAYGHGIRIRGGELNLREIISTQTSGIGINWDNGWTGKGQYWISHLTEAIQDTITLLQGESSSFGESPVSNPIISNVTLIGNIYADTRGLRLKNGTLGIISNTIISTTGRAVRADYATGNILEGKLSFQNSILTENDINYFDNSISSASFFSDPGFNNVESNISLNGFIGSSASNALSSEILDPWFEPVKFVGAVQSEQSDWTKSWVKL